MTVLGRMGAALFAVWLGVTLTFAALRVLPGDAVEARLLQSGASREAIDQRRTELGLNDSYWTQYARFMLRLLQGDMGHSLLSGQSVSEMISQRLLPTIMLASGALLVAVMGGLLLGVLSALDLPYQVSSLADLIVNTSLSVPIYWTGTLLIFVFSAQLHILPSGGGARPSQLVLPVALLGFHTSGSIARVVHQRISEIKTAPYVLVARSKGLSEFQILLRHILRAGLIPVVATIGLQAGYLLSGTVITESLFVRPGIGRLLLDATFQQDYPVVQGIVMVSIVIYVLVNTVTDFVYAAVDPRLSSQA